MLLIEKTFKSPTTCVLVGLFALLLLSLSCSKSTAPDTNKPPDSGPIGVLLSGVDTDPALSGTSDHGPFAVPANEWNGDFATTRLEAVINPSATVGAVNSALNSVGAKFSCMCPGMMFTELVMPPQPSMNEARVICSILVSSRAFLSADPCVTPVRAESATLFPSFPANGIIGYLEQAKFPAAWNVRDRVATLQSPVTVMVVDKFRDFTSHPEIPQQTFISGAGNVSLYIDTNGTAEGNHGFWVAGAIGARFDSVGSTGVYADPANLLRLPCLAIGGLASWYAVIREIDNHLPAGKFILNSSFGYNGDFSVYPKVRRIQHAYYWRRLVALKQDRFLHAQASGNEGLASPSFTNADYSSPFTLAARFDKPLEMLQGTSVSTADTAILQAMYDSVVATDAIYGVKLHNVVTVGSSDWNGNLSTFSNLPSDVRMVGEVITLPCIYDDAQCGPGTGVALQDIVSGTSFATPQVAGLAAWLWSLSPSLTVDETIDIIKDSYYSTYKWVDAYRAVLSLDHTMSNAGIRLSLLDIAGTNSQLGSDLKFDDKDLKMFLDSISAYVIERNATSRPWPKDHAPFDLNGDGYTGDTAGGRSTAPFDLTADNPPTNSSITATFCDGDATLDEHALTDTEILKYYAYSSLYTGDLQIRDSLFGCGTGASVITFLSRRSYALANAGKFQGATLSCPLPTSPDTSSTFSGGPFSFAHTKSYICPDEQGVQLEANSSSGGFADPGFASGAASAIINYSVALSTSVIGKSGVYMSAWGNHFFELRFQIEGDAIPFVAECVETSTDTQNKLHVALFKEGSGNVFSYDGGPGNPSQSFRGSLDPGIYTFSADRTIHLTASEQATTDANGSVQMKIGQTATQ